MDALAITDLVGGYSQADHIVKGVSLNVAAAELVTIIGPNGAGKSTLLKLVAGLLKPRGGRVSLLGADVTGLDPRPLVQAGLIMVPQERNVFGDLSVEENLKMGCLARPRGAKQRIAEICARFPLLAARRRSLARTLSGGQRQLVAMGQALVGEPKVLLLDEPTAGLSPIASAEMFQAIRSICAGGIGVLMVEQNALAAMLVSDRAYVLVDGHNRADGPAPALARDPDIRRLFLGGRGARSAQPSQQEASS